MFYEYCDLIFELNVSDKYFQNFFDKYYVFDQKIINLMFWLELGMFEEIEVLKKKKLVIKDELYVLFQIISFSCIKI